MPFQGVLGILGILGLAWLITENRRKIKLWPALLDLSYSSVWRWFC